MLYLPHEEGQALTEYALIVLLIALVVMVALTALGPIVGNLYSEIREGFP
jgi:pilus assembly protein Flp/PilA